MTKNILSSLWLLFIVTNVNGQTLSPFVVATSGNYYSNSSASLSFTIGEMTMVEKFTNSGNILTQGFQQPFTIPVIPVPTLTPLLIKVYPNPTYGNVNIALTANDTVTITGKLFDIAGREMSVFEIPKTYGQQVYRYDWGMLGNGLYILELYVKQKTVADYKKENHKILIVH